MKIYSSLVIILMLFFTINLSAQEQFGNELTLEETTKISDILANPDDYMGKKVLVEGEVVEVCKNMGCWMELKSDVEGQKIRIKVKDGEIVFRQDLIGKTAVAEGEVYALEFDEEQARDYFEHMAEDAGVEFDPSAVTGPVTIYQVRGSGAVVK